MPYPYGTQGAPTVGNGLGGLPRRAITVAATAAVRRTSPIKLQAVGGVISKTTATTPNIRSMPYNVSSGTGIIMHDESGYSFSGFKFDKTGMLGWASVTSSKSATDKCCPISGMLLNFENATDLYKVTTNGTTTTRESFYTFPTNGNFTDGTGYTSIGSVSGITGNGLRNCLDNDGNYVILRTATLVSSGVTWLCAFTFSPTSGYVGGYKLFALDGSSTILNSTTKFEIRKSKKNLIIAGKYNTSSTYFGLWTVSPTYTVASSTLPSGISQPDGNAPNSGVFFLSDSCALIQSTSYTGYVYQYGALLDSDGAKVNYYGGGGYGSSYYNDIPYVAYEHYDDTFSIYCTAGANKRNVGAISDPAYFGVSRVFSGSGVVSDNTYAMAVSANQMLTAAWTPQEMTGVNGVVLGYMGDGYWALVWDVNPSPYYIRAQLYKEV